MEKIRKYLPFLLIVSLMIWAYVTGLHQALTFDTLRQHQKEIREFVANNPLTAPLAYIALYLFIMILSIPGAFFLTLLGGFLFPQPLATLYVLIGATLGALLFFLAAKLAFGRLLENTKIYTKFNKKSAGYLLFLRLIPFMPFALTNLTAALFNTRFWTFIWTMLLGTLPSAIAYTLAGRSLGGLFAEEQFDPTLLILPEIRIVLLFLALFAFIPILFTRKQTK